MPATPTTRRRSTPALDLAARIDVHLAAISMATGNGRYPYQGSHMETAWLALALADTPAMTALRTLRDSFADYGYPDRMTAVRYVMAANRLMQAGVTP